MPVDDLPDLRHVLRPGIFIIEVVRMLPDVDVENRLGIPRVVRNEVLIFAHAEIERAGFLVVDEPAPA